MPVECPIQFTQLTMEEFRELDYLVMGHAFAAHRELGCLCDEAIYQQDLINRITSAGLAARPETRITLTYRDFRKPLYLDLVINTALVYELKAVAALVREHWQQLLTYLFVLELPAGKLVNFGARSVQHQTVNAVLSHSEQRQFKVDTARWLELTERDRFLAAAIMELASDWGLCLETSLYAEALVHFLGGESAVFQDVPLVRNTATLGSIRLPLLDEQTAFRITALNEEGAGIEKHLCRLLQHTALKRLHWINLKRHSLELVTVAR